MGACHGLLGRSSPSYAPLLSSSLCSGALAGDVREMPPPTPPQRMTWSLLWCMWGPPSRRPPPAATGVYRLNSPLYNTIAKLRGYCWAIFLLFNFFDYFFCSNFYNFNNSIGREANDQGCLTKDGLWGSGGIFGVVIAHFYCNFSLLQLVYRYLAYLAIYLYNFLRYNFWILPNSHAIQVKVVDVLPALCKHSTFT